MDQCRRDSIIEKTAFREKTAGAARLIAPAVIAGLLGGAVAAPYMYRKNRISNKYKELPKQEGWGALSKKLLPGDVVLSGKKLDWDTLLGTLKSRENSTFKYRLSTYLLKKLNGPMSHAGIYIGRGKVVDVTQPEDPKPRAFSLTRWRNRLSKKNMLVDVVGVRTTSDPAIRQRITSLATKATAKNTPYRYGSTGLSLKQRAREFYSLGSSGKLKKNDVFCSSFVASILDRAGVPLKRAPKNMSTLELLEQGRPVVYAGSSK